MFFSREPTNHLLNWVVNSSLITTDKQLSQRKQQKISNFFRQHSNLNTIETNLSSLRSFGAHSIFTFHVFTFVFSNHLGSPLHEVIAGFFIRLDEFIVAPNDDQCCQKLLVRALRSPQSFQVERIRQILESVLWMRVGRCGGKLH